MAKGIVVKLKGKHKVSEQEAVQAAVRRYYLNQFSSPTNGALPLPPLAVKTPVPSDPRDQQSNSSITVLVDTSYDGYYLSFKGYKQRNPESNLRFIDFVEVYDLALRAVRSEQ